VKEWPPVRDRFPLLIVGLLVLLGALATFLMRGAARGSFADKLSTYRSEPDGARALYLLCEKRQVPVRRVQQSLELLGEQQNLALLAVEFSEKSAKQLEHASWMNSLADGGTDDDDDASKRDDASDEDDRLHSGTNLLRSTPVEASEREKLLEHVKSGHTLIYVPWGHGENPLLKAINVALWKADKALELRTLVPGQPTPYTQGVERVETRVQAYLGLPSDAVPLLVDEKLGESVAAVVPYGQGEVIVIGAPELVMNRALARADNAQFWASLLTTVARTGPVGFDEFHHGFTSDRSMADFAARYGLQFAVLQLIGGVCLWAAALRRFGQPRPLSEDIRVGSTDALFATSRLYREGRHWAHAADSILKELSAELAALAALPARSEAAEIAAALKLKGRADLAEALTAVRTAADAVGAEGDVQRVAGRAAAARRLLRVKKPLPPDRRHAQARAPDQRGNS
jgi:hypothetical protein